MARSGRSFILGSSSSWVSFVGILAVASAFVACGDDPSSSAGSTPSSVDPAPAAAPPPAAAPANPEDLVQAGRATYNANCIACHAMDPRTDGALGPAVAGSSPELLEARVLRAEYPAGYVPKRDTRVMVPLPHLEAKLPELAAYLASLGK